MGKAAGRPPARPSYHSLVAEDGMRRPPGVGAGIPPGVEGCWLGGSTVLPPGVGVRHPLPGRAGVLASCRDSVYEEHINRIQRRREALKRAKMALKPESWELCGERG